MALWTGNSTANMGGNMGGGGLFNAPTGMGTNNSGMNNAGFGGNSGGIFGNQPMTQAGTGMFTTGFGQNPSTMNASPSFGLNTGAGNTNQSGNIFNQGSQGGGFGQNNTGMGGNNPGGLFASNTSSIGTGFGNNTSQNPFNAGNTFGNKATSGGFGGFGLNNTQGTQNMFGGQGSNQTNPPGIFGATSNTGFGMSTGMGIGGNTSGNTPGNIFGNNTSTNTSNTGFGGNTFGGNSNIFGGNNNMGNNMGSNMAGNMGNNMGNNLGGGFGSNLGGSMGNNLLGGNSSFGTSNMFGNSSLNKPLMPGSTASFNNNTFGASSSFNPTSFNQQKPGRKFQPVAPKNPKAANTKDKTPSAVACITNQDDFVSYSKEQLRVMYLKNPSMFQNDQQMQQTGSMIGGASNLLGMQNTGMNTGMGSGNLGNTLGGSGNIFGNNSAMGTNTGIGNNNIFGGNNNSFGNTGNQTSNMFGANTSTSTNNQGNLFGNSAFGNAAAAASMSFSQPNNMTQTGNLFGGNANQSGNMFGQNTMTTSPFNQPTNTGGSNLFGNTGGFGQNTNTGALNSTQQTIQQGNQVAMALFQNTTTPSAGSASGGLFSQTKPQTSTGLFTQPTTTSPAPTQNTLFGNTTPQNTNTGSNLFGNTGTLFNQSNQSAAKQPAAPGNSIFGSNLFGNNNAAPAANVNSLFPQPAANPLNNPIIQSAINTTISLFGQSQGIQQYEMSSLPGSLFSQPPAYSNAAGTAEPGRKKVFTSTDKNIDFFDKYALPKPIVSAAPEYKEEDNTVSLFKDMELSTPGLIKYSRALKDDLFGLYKYTGIYDKQYRDMADLTSRTIKVSGPIEFERTRQNMERRFNNDIIDSKNYGFKTPDYSSLDSMAGRRVNRTYNDYRPEYMTKRPESKFYQQPPVFDQWEKSSRVVQPSSNISRPKIRESVFGDSHSRIREPEPERNTEQTQPIAQAVPVAPQLVPIEKVPVCTTLQIKPSLVELSRLTQEELSHVSNVELSNQFGKLIWTKPINLVSVNIDKLVSIQQSCIELDESLSNSCQLHFKNFGDWSKKKQHGDKVKDKFHSKMRKWLLQKKLKMLEWNEDTGDLVAQYEG